MIPGEIANFSAAARKVPHVHESVRRVISAYYIAYTLIEAQRQTRQRGQAR